MTHTVVYLDQNYLSNMAKARLGSMKTEADVVFWQSLFDDLKKAVLDDKIACPQSSFHRYEAMFDRRLEDAIRCVIDELSWGLKFRPSGPYELILESQIEDAAREFLGKQPEKREPWTIAFESDPQAPVESRMHDILGSKGRISVHLSLSDEIVEHDRQLKSRYVEEEDKYRKLDDALRRTYDIDVFLYEKMSFVSSCFLPRQAIISIDKHRQLTRLWEGLARVGIELSDTTLAADFLESDELLNSPYIDIFCSIHAALIKHYPNRKNKQGDFYDIQIVATVLPYCDIVTTDIFMKEILVNILHFDEKYKAKIFSASKADRIAFEKLVRELI